MSDIFVPPGDREVFEEQFIEVHPALGLKATSNSGAYWGDGDARPTAKNTSRLTFAVEMKTRQSSRLTPKPSEFVKAFGEPGEDGQLAKFDSQAVGLLSVFSLEEETYSVSLSEASFQRLQAGLPGALPEGNRQEITRRGEPNVTYHYFGWLGWKDLYEQIESEFK